MTSATLSRIQFGMTLSFHYLFPPLTIGLGVIMVILEAMYLKTGDEAYQQATKFWAKIFALIFAIGVATGIPMEFQFGTNWAHYSRFVGDVFGSALAAEGLFAFFLESGFLAILLFGWERVGKKTHFMATLAVASGSIFSAIWIVIANSFMQTPGKPGQAYRLVDAGTPQAHLVLVHFADLVFNQSSMQRLSHVLMAAFQAGAFLVISVAAYYLIKNRHERFARISMKTALIVALLAAAGQIITGDLSAREVAKYQPAKLAAFEGHYAAHAPAGMSIMGWVDPAHRRVDYDLAIPGMLSWMLYGNTHAPVTGLDAFKKRDQPPAQVVFQTYHAMVAIGMVLMLLAMLGVFFWWRGTLWTKTWFLRILVVSVILPEAGNQLGWFSAEVGRQPWIVYGLLRTVHGVSSAVAPGEIVASLGMFFFMYVLLTFLFFYLLNHKIAAGPADPVAQAQQPNVPLLYHDRAAT